MITINNKTYRNLEEQVQKNMDDINKFAQGTQILADFGIKIVGHVDDSSDLPDPAEYGGEYGDAYIVGDEEPYLYYIFTRAEVGEQNPYWFNLGQFPVPGPQGEQGPEGPVGETPNVNMQIGTVSTLNPDQSATVSVIPSGYGSDNPLFTLNFGLPKGQKGDTGATGPQGPTGPQGQKGDKGEKGDQGGLIDIVGIVATASLLPTPESLDKLDAAYLVGEEENYELYIQVGETPATAIWTNIGYFNNASVVTVDGVPQDTWEADSKVSVSEGHLVNTLYGQIAGTGNGQVHVPYSNTASGNAIVQRDANGQVIIPETPTANGMAASKKYVDDKASSLLPLQYKGDIIVSEVGGVPTRLAMGSANQFLQVNSAGTGLQYASVSEVPSYSNSDASKVLAVNNSATALEWISQSSGGGGGGDSLWKNSSSEYSATINPQPVDSKYTNYKINSSNITNNIFMDQGRYNSAPLYNLSASSEYGIVNNICTGNLLNIYGSSNTTVSKNWMNNLCTGNLPINSGSASNSLILTRDGTPQTYSSISGLGSSTNLSSSIFVYGGSSTNFSGPYSSKAWNIKGSIILFGNSFSSTRSSVSTMERSIVASNHAKTVGYMIDSILCGDYVNHGNFGEKFIVGASDSTYNKNAFTVYATTPNDIYVKIGNTQITEANAASLNFYKHYVCITDSDSNYHKFIFKSNLSTAYTSISTLMTNLMNKCLIERVTYVDPEANTGAASSNDLYYGNVCMISEDSTNGYVFYYSMPYYDAEAGDRGLENRSISLDITGATISDTVTDL